MRTASIERLMRQQAVRARRDSVAIDLPLRRPAIKREPLLI
jgi:hypothetical protein